MKSLKQVLKETGEYQEPEIQVNEVPDFQYPEDPCRKRWLTLGDLFCASGKFIQAIVWGFQNALAIFIWACIALMLLSSIVGGCHG